MVCNWLYIKDNLLDDLRQGKDTGQKGATTLPKNKEPAMYLGVLLCI